MGDGGYLASRAILDASPLIYLAKLEALDVLSLSVSEAWLTPTVLEEVTRPQVAYRHPDGVRIEQAVAAGALHVIEVTATESQMAAGLAGRIAGLHAGEAEVLAVAVARAAPAVIFERRARRVAASIGAQLLDVVELIVAGTPDQGLREDRVVRFARIVDLRLDDAMALLARIRSTRLGPQGGGS